MIKIGITGQQGFIGYHLFQLLSTKENVKIIHFEDHFFDELDELDDFVMQCDVIVHLAGVNRHTDEKFVYFRNVELAELLVRSCERMHVKPHILFASSTQENRDNPYGKGKKDARLLLEQWCRKNDALFTGMVFPNIFGPFCRPYYNSVVATFCHQILQNEKPNIVVDAEVELLYVTILVQDIFQIIIDQRVDARYIFKISGKITVSGLLRKLNIFYSTYITNHQIPPLEGEFDIALFNTFRSYSSLDDLPIYLQNHADNRGNLFEVLKEKTGGQIFFSSTKPGITRGDHFHLNKIERFCVVKGRAIIRLRKVGEEKTYEFEVSGDKPSIIDMPVFYTHNITNISDTELLTLFWSNEIFDKDNPDTYYQKV
jgi:UDP-2-acetamido-2,6-beta-L-arabino-hexul-4-ose reductase